jgi:O-antigen/teichoic acid export membrane protein
MTAVNGLLTLWRSIPNLIVGAMLGFEALGLFARSQNLTLLFKRATIDAAQPVLQPMLMKAGRNGAQLEAIYVRKVTFLSALAWPFFTFLLLMAEPAIILILGRQWSNAVPATQILCLIGFTVPFNSLLSRFHIAEGLIRRYLYGQVIVLVTATALVAGASFVSVEMVCAALVAESLLRSILSHYLLHSTGRYRFSLLAPTLRSSGILTAVSALPPLAAQAADAAATYGTLPTFFVVAAASAVLWFGTARLLRHDLADEVIRLASRAWTVIFNRRLHSVE